MPSQIESKQRRHVDKGILLDAFASEAIVTCPKCKGPAVVTSRSRSVVPYVAEGAKLTCLRCAFHSTSKESGWLGPGIGIGQERCPNCGHKWLTARVDRRTFSCRERSWATVTCPECQKPTRVPLEWCVRRVGAAVDPAFGLPLWLQESCGGETLWAYNERHLIALQDYVAATIRERVGVMQWSMFSRLPKWLSAHKNRDAVLHSIERLKRKLPRP